MDKRQGKMYTGGINKNKFMKNIVVIEDEPILLKGMSIELLSAGFNVLSASNGKAGLELVKKEKPDLVLLDLLMPQMGGFEVLAELKKDASAKHIPVIILSNLNQAEDKEKAKKLGAVDYYVKSSTDLSDLTKKVAGLLK